MTAESLVRSKRQRKDMQHEVQPDPTQEQHALCCFALRQPPIFLKETFYHWHQAIRKYAYFYNRKTVA